jgi:hypothetical protein
MEIAAAWEVFLAVIGAPRTYLDCSAISSLTGWCRNVQLESVEEYQFSQDYRSSLEVNCLPTRVAKILYLKHIGIKESGSLGHAPFECCKERGIVECPF